MSDQTLSLFLIVLSIVFVAIKGWRITLYLLGALIITVLIFGVYGMMSAMEHQADRVQQSSSTPR